MNLNDLRALMAGPLAALFLVLTLVMFGNRGSVSTGIHVPVTHVRQIAFSECYDDRDIFVFIRKDGSIRINETPERLGDVKRVLSDIFSNGRTQAVVYVIPDPETLYDDFARAYNQVAVSATNFHVGLITTGLDQELRMCGAQVCGLEWPDRGYQQSCLFMNIPPVVVPGNLHFPSATTKSSSTRTSEN